VVSIKFKALALPLLLAVSYGWSTTLFADAALVQSHPAPHGEPQQHSTPDDARPHVPQTGHEHMTENGGGHGMLVARDAKLFPTIGYDDARIPRPAQTMRGPAMTGDPAIGKQIAQSDKGRCLSCHVLDQDGVLAGTLGPNLSTYGTWGRDTSYTFRKVWDARVHNPRTIMPPFGTDDLLTEVEVANIVAYLHTLKQMVPVPQHPAARKPRERVYVAGDDFSAADEYIDAGLAAFRQTGNNGQSCVSCHAAGAKASINLSSAASRYPRFDQSQGRVVGLEEQINDCRTRRMDSEAFPLGGPKMNQLTGYVKLLGRGKPIDIKDNSGMASFERGRASFYRKTGTLNFSCADCHVASEGKWLRGQRVQKLDQTAGEWPKHFIALHDLGLISLRQRIQHCQIITGTLPLPLHAQEYLDLEYFMTRLANGSPLLAPTMTRLRGE
jgi:L-cysteine S-thiosulfotransferase